MHSQKFLSAFVFLLAFSAVCHAQSAGHFIANAVNAVGSGNDKANMYDKLAIVSYENQKQINNIWVQSKYENFRLGSGGNFNDDIGGLSFGYDREIKENLSAGFFGKYDSHCLSQKKSSADINSYGIGAYGGYLYDDFDFKGIFSISGQQYSVSRDAGVNERARSGFNGYDVNADFEAAVWLEAMQEVNIRPYVGLNLGYTGYGSSSEIGAGLANLDTDGGSFSRSGLRFGAAVNGKYEKFGWYGGIEFEYIISGTYAEIKSTDEGTNTKVTLKGAQTDSAAAGFNAGGDYNISGNLKAYANLAYKVSGGLSDFTLSSGIAFVFDSF